MDDDQIIPVEEPPKRSNTPIIIGALAVVLIIVFIIVIIVFFNIGNPPPTHQIAIVNNCTQDITAAVDIQGQNGLPGTKGFSARIAPQQVIYYSATPGVNLEIRGTYDDPEILLTTVNLSLAGQNYDGPSQISYNNNIINGGVLNNNPTDIYGVSLQEGFNIPVSIVSTAFNNKNPQDRFSCGGPEWLSSSACPPGSTDDYCFSPCSQDITYCCKDFNCGGTASCQSTWPDQSYYASAVTACPNCLITGCDQLNYHCSSSGGLTQYTITFCPGII